MSKPRGPLGKLIDVLKDGISEALGQLAPQPDVIPVPVRNDPRRPRR